MDFRHESSHLNNNLASFTIMEDYVVAKLIKIFNKMPVSLIIIIFLYPFPRQV